MWNYISVTTSSSNFFQFSTCATIKQIQIETLQFKGQAGYCHVSANEYVNKSDNINFDDGYSSSSSESSSDSDNKNYQDDEEQLRRRILDSALNYVNLYGWSSSSISKGAEDIGYSRMVHGMFNDGTDLVNYFYMKCNNELEENLRKIVEKNSEAGIEMSKSKFIREALEIRLRMNEGYLENWSQALAIHANPLNVQQALNNLGTIADHIWYYAGDRSYDFNWYTKRASLAAIYKIAELSMLQDKSPGLEHTFSSLDRRINDLQSISKVAKEFRLMSKDVSNFGKATFVTALNIIGMNSKSR